MRRLVLAAPLIALALAAGAAFAAPQKTTLRISADPKGAMKFDRSTLRAKPGVVVISMRNPVVVPHNVAVRGNGVRKLGKVVLKGGTSTVTVTLKRGRYVLFCSVAGHEKAGMKGTLIVG